MLVMSEYREDGVPPELFRGGSNLAERFMKKIPPQHLGGGAQIFFMHEHLLCRILQKCQVLVLNNKVKLSSSEILSPSLTPPPPESCIRP